MNKINDINYWVLVSLKSYKPGESKFVINYTGGVNKEDNDSIEVFFIDEQKSLKVYYPQIYINKSYYCKYIDDKQCPYEDFVKSARIFGTGTGTILGLLHNKIGMLLEFYLKEDYDPIKMKKIIE